MSDANPVGRPTLYDERLHAIAGNLAKLGLIDDEIADALGIARSTLYEWKNRYPDFSDAINGGKVLADAVVVSKLYDRACGAEWVEQQAFKVRRGSDEEVEVVDVRRASPPDTAACIFWLKNRQPKHWRDRVEESVSDVNEAAVELQRIASASRATTE
jgi:hypothetical protein